MLPKFHHVFAALLLFGGFSMPLSAAAGSAGYDSSADAFADLKQASQKATENGKHILLEVGGEWCSWCHVLEKFMHEHDEVEALVEAHYVVVKVNYSDEHPNQKFLSQFPAISGYPHLFVLDAQGQLLRSQSTGELESGKGYSKTAFLAFLKKWAPSGDPS